MQMLMLLIQLNKLVPGVYLTKNFSSLLSISIVCYNRCYKSFNITRSCWSFHYQLLSVIVVRVWWVTMRDTGFSVSLNNKGDISITMYALVSGPDTLSNNCVSKLWKGPTNTTTDIDIPYRQTGRQTASAFNETSWLIDTFPNPFCQPARFI